jgi:hypothetical protein
VATQGDAGCQGPALIPALQHKLKRTRRRARAGNGGALYISAGAVSTENCTFTRNEGLYGGAIALDSSAALSSGGLSAAQRAAGCSARGDVARDALKGMRHCCCLARGGELGCQAAASLAGSSPPSKQLACPQPAPPPASPPYSLRCV